MAVSFAAIDPFVERVIPSPVERRISGKDIIEWGDGNAYPDYLLDLYNNVTTLRSIINGLVDFAVGDDITIDPQALPGVPAGCVNIRGDSIRDFDRDIKKDVGLYGGAAFQVIRNFVGDVAELYYIDMRFLRMNKDADVFYYSEHWNRPGMKDVVEYPAFRADLDWASLDGDARNRNASSIVFIKSVHTQTYPAPLYAAAVKACEIERAIDDYHLNALENGFTSSMIVNFNNGNPTDQIKEQVEEDFTSKFSGHQNAGRIMFSWNKNKDSATEIIEPKIEDFGERYKALAEHSRQQIFTAFRAVPNLFGLPTATGFSTEEFEAAFRLFNRTMVRPIQRLVAEAFEKVFGRPVVTVKPFSLDEDQADANVI